MPNPSELGITPQDQDFSQWYLDVVRKAELADYGPARGTQIIREDGQEIWERIQQEMDTRIKSAGVRNVGFPLVFPESLLHQEQEHIEGFAPYVAVVTHGGGKQLEEPLVVRPTSEAVIYDYLANSGIIQSYRDLPHLINQWVPVVRWELRTIPFLRTLEFQWQEGHTLHETHQEAWQEVIRALKMYEAVYQDVLAIPGINGVKSEKEKFAGAEATTTLELLMQNGKALQGCTSHDLGQNFSRAYGVQFTGRDNQLHYPWTTSWGFTTRSIGAMVMVHGDDKGLRIPPKVAPTQAVIVPVSYDKEVLQLASGLNKLLQMDGIRTNLDDDPRKSPGRKYYHWEMKGVPLRFEIGRKEVESGRVTVYRRDTGERTQISVEYLLDATPRILDSIQQTLLNQATKFLQANTHRVDDFGDFREIARGPGGFIKALWCEQPACETAIKEETKATTRCLPFDSEPEEGNCIYCGSSAKNLWLFSQSY